MYIVEKRSEDSLELQTATVVELAAQKVENAIFEKYHFSLKEHSKNKYQLDGILRTVFGQNRIMLEKIVLENAQDLVTSKKTDKGWLTIQDKSLITKILLTCADKKKKRILKVLYNKQPHIIAEIVEISGLPEDMAYEKINQLIRDGMLIEQGAMFTSDAREIKKYVRVFKNLRFGLLNNKISIRTKLSKGALKASYMIALLQSVKNQMVEEQQKNQTTNFNSKNEKDYRLSGISPHMAF